MAKEEYVLDKKGKRRGVIVPIKRYEKLMADLHDLAVVAERRDEESVRLEDVKARLRKDGLL